MKIKVLSFDQPSGTYYFGVAPAIDIAKISAARRRQYNPLTRDTEGGVQREKSRKRIKEIAEYAKTRDASFPNAVILALPENSYTLEGGELIVDQEGVADIVDGQHRIEGLKFSNKLDQFELPVVFLLEPTEEEKALIFATINGKQTPVPASVVYDLFGVTKSRSPQKTAHEIARALNSSDQSPWQGRLKMLGKKTKGSDESLTQGTFIKFLLPLLSVNPSVDLEGMKDGGKPIKASDRIFNEYFYNEEDTAILKILLNVFNAVKHTWSVEWSNPKESILTKTTGYTGIMKALPDIFVKGKAIGHLSSKYFDAIFFATKEKMEHDNVSLISSHFQSSSIGEDKLKNYIISASNSIDFKELKKKLDKQESHS